MTERLGSKSKRNPANQALRIAAYYFVISIFWILITDFIVNYSYNVSFSESLIETGKGILFVTVTSLLLYFLLRRSFHSLKEINRKVKISEEKYRMLADNVNIGIIRNNIDGSYNYLNSTAKKIISQSLIDENVNIIGKKPEDVFKDPETVNQIYLVHNLAVSSKSSVKRKFKFNKQYISVEAFPEFDASGKMVSILKLYTDETIITERLIKHKESELFNKHLLNFSDVLIYIFDVQKHNNVFVNEAIYHLTGYSKDDLSVLGDSFFNQLIHPDDISGFAKHVEDTVMKLPDGEFSEYEYRLKCKNGYYKWFKGNNTVYKRNENGEATEILGSSVDITELKKTQEELTVKTEYLKTVIDASPMSIFDINSEGKIHSIWNKSSEDIFGWRKEEVLGKTLPLVPEDELINFSKQMQNDYLKRDVSGNVYHCKRKNDSEIMIKVSSRPIFGKNGKPDSILTYNEDVTLQKKYEEDIKKNEEFLKLLYEASLAANHTTDKCELYKKCFGYIEKILTVTGIVVSLVTEDRKHIKYDAIWVNGEDIDTSKVPLMELRPEGQGPHTKTIHTGKALIINDLEECLKVSNNSYFIDSEGNICSKDDSIENVSRAVIMIPLKHESEVIGVLHVQSYKTNFYTEEDLHKLEPFAYIIASALQRAELYQKLQNELLEKEIAFQQIRKFSKGIENSPNSIVITNSNYEIEYVNPYFTKHTGYTFEEVRGKNPNILKSGQTKLEVYEGLWETLKNGETWHGEFLNLKKSGELYWESASIGPITDSYGKITHFIAIKQDITEQKKMDKELKDSLEEKNVMIKEIHHRVKNNLQVISSLLNMQVEQYKNPEVIEALNSSRSRVKSMALVHENLYKSSNIGKSSMKEYIHMLAANIYSSYGITIDGINFRVEANAIEFGLDTIIPLGLILNEAISNSLKHAFQDNMKGEVFVELKKLTYDGKDNQFELRIKDNGIGLPEGFDPGKSNSLGMVLITSLASQLDGKAVFKNGTGMEITIQFSEQ